MVRRKTKARGTKRERLEGLPEIRAQTLTPALSQGAQGERE